MTARKSSYSEIVQHRNCPQKWYYARVLHLVKEQEDTAPALHMGIAWHALRAADSLERAERWGGLLAEPKEIELLGQTIQPDELTTPAVLDAAITYWQHLDTEAMEAWTKAVGEPLPDRLRTLNARWSEEHAADLEHERPLAVEMGWSRELPNSADRLVGYVDEVYLDTRRNLVVVRDHKTSKTLGIMSAQDDMMASQLQLYAWGANKRIASWGLGSVTATAYDRVRTMRPTTPRLTKGGQLSKQITQYDLATYLAWVHEGQHYEGTKKDGSGAGVYAAEQHVIDHLSSPSWRSNWFQQTLVPINPNIVKAHLRAAMDTMEDIGRTEERGRRDGFAQRNLTDGCKWCDFNALCRAQMVGGPDGTYPLGDYNLKEKV